MGAQLVGTAVETALVAAIVVGACVLDVAHNPRGHPRRFVVRRFLNWFLVGITYASTYFGRYNMNVANTRKVYDILGVTSAEFGWVITVGFVSYAVFVVLNGFVVDKIGGSRAMWIGAYGSAVFNVLEGVFAVYGPARLQGAAAIAVLCGLYACNNFFQTFCTSAICKVAVNWYHLTERGFFSGIFGVNGVVIEHAHWSWIFFLPAVQLAVLGTLNMLYAYNTPEEARLGYSPFDDDAAETKPLIRSSSDGREGSASSASLDGAASSGSIQSVAPAAAAAAKPTVGYLFTTVFLNPVFLLLCVVDVCLGWSRDGVLSWYAEVLDDRFGRSTTSNEFALATGGTTIGGMFGSLAAGILSDTLFGSRRTPVAFLFFLVLTGTFSAMLATAASPWGFAALIAASAVWLNGLNGLITSTCAMDFAGSAATATAVGLLDGVQKIGSSLTGRFMGMILDARDSRPTASSASSASSASGSSGEDEGPAISEAHYRRWVLSLVPAVALAAVLLVPIINRKPPQKRAPIAAAAAAPCAAAACAPQQQQQRGSYGAIAAEEGSARREDQ
eukprot:m51a1_g1065 hypothetical protein (559) ;mRNA; r:834803-837131